MKTLLSFVTFASVALISVNSHSSDPAHVQACKAKVMNHFKVSHKYFMDCHAETKDANDTPEEMYKKLGCSVKCILKKEGLLDENDMASEALMKSGVKDRVTEDYADKLAAKFMECNTKLGGKLDKEEKSCQSYKDFGLCTQEAVSHVCYE